MAVYGYIRVSTVEQVAGFSLQEQENKICGAALIRGETVDRVFCDPGVSGAKPLEQRPAGADLVAALQPGDTLIAAKLDRMFRSAADALSKAEAWQKAGIHLVLVDVGVEPVTNGMAKLFFSILAAVAEFERYRIRERQAEGQRGKRSKGGHVGGNRPFGFNVVGKGRNAKLVPIPEEQAAIDRMAALRAEGKSLRSIAEAMKVEGFLVSHAGVKNVLERVGAAQ